MIRPFFLFSLLLCFPLLVFAQAPLQTRAKQAIVVDYETGTILFEKNAQEKMPTSSMSKVMSIYLVFEKLKRGDIAMGDTFPVSEKAWRKGGSKMFVEVNKRVKIEDLIRGVAVQSGNDATIVLAEGLSGSESAFADSLNEKAQALGMVGSHFMNASGWPDPDHYSTATDLALLASATIKNFPDYYKYYGEKEFTYNNITQQNRNPLLYKNIAADGLKTGHTEAGGYGLIGTGEQGGRRVIIVVNGLDDEKARAEESAMLLEWGLTHFENHTLFTAGQAIESVKVALGRADSVPAIIKDKLTVSLPKLAKTLRVRAKFIAPLKAPVKKGQHIGTLEVSLPYGATITRPLYAGKDVRASGFFAVAVANIKRLLSGQGGL